MIESPHPHELVLVGLSHQTAPLDVRARCSVSKEALGRRLVEVREASGAAELLILSTCNRTELLGAGPDGVLLEERLKESFPPEARPLLYAHQGAEAVFHVFSVCGGLRSMVVGEAEIQGQFKEAWRASQEAGCSGTMLEAIAQQALRAGKRLRTETELGSGTLSVAGAAVELITKVHGQLADCSVLVIGAGETGLLLARHLEARGVRRLAFANRTAQRAAAAAETFGASVVPFESIHRAAIEHDIVVTCVQATEPVLRASELSAVRWPNRDLPKIFVDLSVPRAIDSAVSRLNDAFLFDLDALQAVVDQHLGQRLSEVGRAEQIIVDEVRKFLALRTYAALGPAVSELAEQFERARREWAEARHGRGAADLDAASEELSQKLLAIALGQMKAGARLTQSEAALERSWRRYREQHK
jgi:glutamyl-tRNA reductase